MDNVMEMVLHSAVEILTPVLLSAAVAALGVLVRHLNNKYKIELSDETRTELRRLASDAVDLTNEYAHSVIKRVVGSPESNEKKLTSEQKFHFAVNELMQSAKKHNLTRARAENLVLIAVGEARKWENDK